MADGAEQAATQAPDDGQDLATAVAELEDKLARSRADAANSIKRAQDEARRMAAYAGEDLARSFLDVADNLERALDARPQGPAGSAEAVIEGVALTLSGLQSTFASIGIETIDPEPGTKPDPHLHQTIMLEASAEYGPGCVIRTVQKGYRMHQRLLRAAKVIASQQRQDQQAEPAAEASSSNQQAKPPSDQE